MTWDGMPVAASGWLAVAKQVLKRRTKRRDGMATAAVHPGVLKNHSYHRLWGKDPKDSPVNYTVKVQACQIYPNPPYVWR